MVRRVNHDTDNASFSPLIDIFTNCAALLEAFKGYSYLAITGLQVSVLLPIIVTVYSAASGSPHDAASICLVAYIA